MEVSEPVGTVDAQPDPGQARTLAELIEQLRSLKRWAGDPSFETIKNRINAAWRAAGRPAGELTSKTTVIDCFRTDRRRLNTDLVVAVVQALHPDVGYVAQWRQALRVIGGEVLPAAQVRGQDTLPDDIVEFTGRATELDRLRQIFSGRASGRANSGDPVVISAIEGMAGVGKTRLAVHAGHLLGRTEPFDRTLFVNLRGFHPDPTQPPADPAAVLDSFLRLLGVPGQEIPHELPARTTLYRQRLAGVRALVVLDDAADEAQVAPLLPDSPGCVTLITSRGSLAGLRSAIHLPVAVFTPAEALDLLARATPGRPVGADPDAAARLAHRCGYLPLALGLVAGHIRSKPGWTLTDHADWLDERHEVRRLDGGVELALGLSYGHLPAQRQRLFRLLALHPGQDLDAYAAAALADLTVDAAAEHLHRLVVDHHLLLRTTPGRFAFHDLVRAYAAGRASDEDRPADRRAALTRLFDYYLYSAAAIMDTIYPAERDSRPRVPVPTTPTPDLADPDAARGWLDAERVNLIASAGHTAAHGWPEHAIRLAGTLFRHLDLRGHSGDAVTVHTHARQAARSTGDRTAEGHALTNLGTAHWRQGRYQHAADHYREALTRFREVGDRPGEARALTNLSAIHCEQGRYEPAAADAQRALELHGELGDRLGAARVLASLGIVFWMLGRYPEAIDHHERALALNRELGERASEAVALNGLGLVYERLGRYREAAEHQQQALAVYREVGHRSGEAYVLADLGVIHRGMGRYRQAADHLQQALTQFRDVGDTGGEANALNGLGETLTADGRPDQARDHHAKAHLLAVQIGDRYEQARALAGTARAHHATGDPGRARRYWQDALAIYAELGVPEADRVRGYLSDL